MAENTFLGLQPYTEDDAYRFKGRTEESQELFRLIVRNGFTVCYAESGEGKTSLLNAGVFPLLRENMYFPISITFTSDDYKVTPDSFDTIIDRCIKDSIAEYNEKNKGVNVEYRLCSTDFIGLDCQAELQRELSEYSWWKLRNYKPQAMGLIFTPVFVFDQFEEVFNLPGSIVWTKKFFDWLEDVSSDSCPEEIVEKTRAIIGNKAAFPTIKEEKGFRAVFSLRKEFIGELDYWGMQTHFIPALKDNRYCLKPLTYEGSKKVMTQQERFDEGKVKQVLDYFVQKYSREPEKIIEENLPAIPALLLSVVGDSWEKDINTFTTLNTAEIGQSLNLILEKFYDETIETVVNELVEKNHVNNTFLRDDIDSAIYDLVDINGKRVRVKAVTTRGTVLFREKNEKELRICKYKEILRKHRIIRVTKIDGEDYVEIVHDALCSVIANKQERKMKELADKAIREVEENEKLKRKKLQRNIKLALGTVVFLSCMTLWYFLYRPQDVRIRLYDASIQNNNLPPLRDAIVSITLSDGDRTDTIHTITQDILFTGISKHFIGDKVHVSVECQDYVSIDTTIILTLDNKLNIYRNDSVYGNIKFRLWNTEKDYPVTDAIIEIDGMIMENEKGLYTLRIPLGRQKSKYVINSSIPLWNDTLYLPCGPDDVILTKSGVPW